VKIFLLPFNFRDTEEKIYSRIPRTEVFTSSQNSFFGFPLLHANIDVSGLARQPA